MMDCRLFFMGDGRIQGAVEIHAAADLAAIAGAERVRGGRAAELWNRARRVRAFSSSEGGRAHPSPDAPDRLPA